MITVALLKKWVALESDHWICQLEGDYCWIALSSYQRNRVYILEELGLSDKAILQAGLQYAIAAKPGWDLVLQLTRNLKDEATYFGIVRRQDGSEFVSEDYTEPAIALLEAYVAALEANKAAISQEATP